VELMEVDN